MVTRFGVLAFILSCSGACSQSPTDPAITVASIAGAYALADVNGAALPCCIQHVVDSASKTETWAASKLVLHPDSTYTWTVTLRFDWRAGHDVITELRDSIVAHGSYSTPPGGLLFQDPTRGVTGSFSGTMNGDTVALTRDAAHYAFARVPPPVVTGDWVLAECRALTGGPAGCPTTDSTEAVETITGGELQISDGPAAGRYTWNNRVTVVLANGTSSVTTRAFSRGTYTWDNTTLVLTDSSGTPRTMTGRFAGGPLELTVRSPTRSFLFFTLPSLPSADKQ